MQDISYYAVNSNLKGRYMNNKLRFYAFGMSIAFLVHCQTVVPNLATVGENLWHLNRRIGDRVCDIHDCSPIPVSAGGTLSVPGTYCLTQNITGTISISNNDITLLLNGFSITAPTSGNGISITASTRNCRISGGSIVGDGSSNNSIVVGAGASEIFIDDVHCTGTPIGLNIASGAGKITVTNCGFRDHSSRAMSILANNGLQVKHCFFTNNSGTQVVSVFGGRGVVIEDCFFTDNQGLANSDLIRFVSGFYCVVKLCKFTDNVSLGDFVAVSFGAPVGCIVDSCDISGCGGGAGSSVRGIDFGLSTDVIATHNKISNLFTSDGNGSLTGILLDNYIGGLIKENSIELSPQSQTTLGVSLNSPAGREAAWIQNSIRVSLATQVGPPASMPRIIHDLSAGTLTPTPSPATVLHNLGIVD